MILLRKSEKERDDRVLEDLEKTGKIGGFNGLYSKYNRAEEDAQG